MKKFLTMVLVGVFVLGITALDVSAYGNIKDTAFSFTFSDWVPYTGWLTEQRAKQDYTSSYMSCYNAAGSSYYGTVMGAKPGSELGSLVGSPTYTFQGGSTRWMINYVKERGFNYAVIDCMPAKSGSYSVSGVWSPDSV